VSGACSGNRVGRSDGSWPNQASGERLVWVSRVAVLVWAIIMGIAMSVAQVANINVNFLITIIGARPPRASAPHPSAHVAGVPALAAAHDLECSAQRSVGGRPASAACAVVVARARSAPRPV
jgi:hypothetical protein